LARGRGARTIATAEPGEQTRHVQSLGASHVVDHTQDLTGQIRQLAPGGVDVVLHLAGDPVALADHVAGGGRFASLLNAGADLFPGRNITATAVIASPHRAVLESLAGE